MAKKKKQPPKKNDGSQAPVEKKAKKSGASQIYKYQQLFGIGLGLFSLFLLFLFISYFFYWEADQSVWDQLSVREVLVHNSGGKLGAKLSYILVYKGFGLATVILIWMLLFTGLKMLIKIESSLLDQWFWGTLLMVFFATLLGFFSGKGTVLAGVSGYELNHWLQDYLGTAGTVLLLVFLWFCFSIFKLHITPSKMIDFVQNSFAKFRKDKTLSTDDDENNSDTDEDSEDESDDEEDENDDIFIPQVDDEPIDPFTHEKEIPLLNASGEKKGTLIINDTSKNDEPVEAPIVPVVPAPLVDAETLAQQLVQDYGEYDPRLDLSEYRFPTLDLLKTPENSSIVINEEELKENNDKIIRVLKDYKIEIEKIKATPGPTVTLYEIVPVAGIRISKIKSLEDDIALKLAAKGIRIIAPIPGKGTIGIEVPNQNGKLVFMRTVITSPRFQHAEMDLPIAFGKTISNETFVADLTKMPHLLMAGATGQGKSVGINVVLASLLYKKHPSELKFVLVDPKKVELSIFEHIERHFLAKLPDSEEAIITDTKKVVNTLNSLCIEMDNRYELLKNAQARNIKEYNAKFKLRQLNPNEGHRFLPYIVLVVDEFADLIMTAGKEVEYPIGRVAQLARAIGIHLIIATQRPSVNVITGVIKANFPARIAFKVPSKIDSKTILDGSGAEQLIGRGDMLYTQGNEMIRIQCAFVDTPEIQRITEYIGSQRAYPNAYLLPEYVGPDSEPTDTDFDPSERDSMFREAAEVVVTAQQGSASLLQRKLKLGYNRAGRLIDQLEHAGIVGPFEGSKARQVLVQDIVSLDRLLGGNE